MHLYQRLCMEALYWGQPHHNKGLVPNLAPTRLWLQMEEYSALYAASVGASVYDL
jgi:hypothetical protein